MSEPLNQGFYLNRSIKMNELTYSSGSYSSIRVASFEDGHKYESYCECERCKRVTADFEAAHAAAQKEAEARLDKCPFCGGDAHIEYEGVVHFLVNEGFPSNGVWVECDDCSCQLGCGGMTSQEDRIGSYDSWDEAVDAWKCRN